MTDASHPVSVLPRALAVLGTVVIGLVAVSPVTAVAAPLKPVNGTVSQYAGATWTLPGIRQSTVEIVAGVDETSGRSVAVVEVTVTQVSCEGGKLVERKVTRKLTPAARFSADVRRGTARADAVQVQLAGTATTRDTCLAGSAVAATTALSIPATVDVSWVAQGEPLRYEDRGQRARFWYQDAVATGSLTVPGLELSALGRSTTAYLQEAVYTEGAQDQGYWALGSDGGVFAFGTGARFFGSLARRPGDAKAVAIAANLDGDGYWLATADGGVFAYGAAVFRGSAGALRLNSPIVDMAATPSGRGYWLVAADGGVFAFGDARFLGSTGAIRLNRPVVGLEVSPTGDGYWLVASDGGVFAFGDALFAGSTGAIRLNKPVVGIDASPYGDGYRLVASDGGVFAFGGNAPFRGSTGAFALKAPVGALAGTPSGDGYWLVAEDGGVFAFGDARFLGSLVGKPLGGPIVSIVAAR